MFIRLRHLARPALFFAVVALAGCESEPYVAPNAQNSLGIGETCYPPGEYLVAVRKHVRSEVETHLANAEHSPAIETYDKLSELFSSAESDLIGCLGYAALEISDLGIHDDFLEEAGLYGQLFAVSSLYGICESEWNPLIAEPISMAFDGVDLYEDDSWTEAVNCGEPCEAENIKNHSSTQREATGTQQACAP